MHYCCVKLCGKNTKTSGVQKDGISFHRFPKSPYIKEKWIQATHREGWFPNDTSTICSRHFTADCFHEMGQRRRLNNIAVPTCFLPILSNEASQPNTSPSDSNLSTPSESQDPLKKGTLEQCRFCGDFRKDCIDLTTDHKPYLEKHKTSLTVNGLSIELDFNDATLPKTVCCNCDRKLQEMMDFVKKVIDMRDSLINVADVETVVVKVEGPETTEDQNDCNDDALEVSEVFTHKSKPQPKQKKLKDKRSGDSELANEQNEIHDTAQGNSVSNASENTVFTHKRKSNVTRENNAKKKNFKVDIPVQKNEVRPDQRDNSQLVDTQGRHNVGNVTCEDTELITDIKEENTETEDLHEEIHFDLEEVDNKPDEAELASNVLAYEMSNS